MNSQTRHSPTQLLRFALCVFAGFASLLFLPVLAISAENPKAVYDRIGALDDSYSACTSQALSCTQSGRDDCKAMTCNTGNMFLGGDTTERDALVEKLKAQYTAGDLTAAFYWGYLNWTEGGKISDTSTKLVQEYQMGKYKEAYAGFLRASEGGVGEGSWNIAVMYEQGNGLTRSKLAAAEWYAKAGRQHLKNGNREQALAALERIEEIDAKHPDAIKLRAILFPSSKGK